MIALVSAAHSGVPRPRTAPELSDAALFVMAVVGVFLARRALRARFAKNRQRPQD
ncbi:hypothetical protein [Sphingomonas sp.]|uniref:hypothetical protein n=1 Tax=Sphingomonas sp. TaxID=28214 RepID=UPI001D64A187|nr:hypothetical protein [Sphingomonas sp.]MBX9797003.1 hypothetical protein [Sphingomonas sp.]